MHACFAWQRFCSIDWNVLSACATIFASGLALYLADKERRDRKRKAIALAMLLKPGLNLAADRLQEEVVQFTAAGPSRAAELAASPEAARRLANLLRMEELARFRRQDAQLPVLPSKQHTAAIRAVHAIDSLDRTADTLIRIASVREISYASRTPDTEGVTNSMQAIASAAKTLAEAAAALSLLASKPGA